MGDWDAPPIEAPAAAKAIWEVAYAEPPDAPPSEKSEQLWGPDCQQSSEPEAEAAAEAGAVSTQGLEQASGMEHGEEELEKPAEDPAGKAANPNEPAPYPWRQAQYQRCSPAKRRRLSTLDHGVLISWHRHFGSGGELRIRCLPRPIANCSFFPSFSRTQAPGFARFPSFEGERVLVHCADTNFEPRVGDGIEGIVNRRAKDNKLQAFKVFSYYYSSSLHPPSKAGVVGEILLNRTGEPSGDTERRAPGRGLDPQVTARYRVSLPRQRTIFYYVARCHTL